MTEVAAHVEGIGLDENIAHINDVDVALSLRRSLHRTVYIFGKKFSGVIVVFIALRKMEKYGIDKQLGKNVFYGKITTQKDYLILN